MVRQKIKKNIARYCARPYDMGRAFILLAAAIIGTLSLATYDAHDPSILFYSTQSSAPHNICGTIGANCAAILMYLFGEAAPIFVLCILFASYIFFTGVSWLRELDRIIAFVVFMVSTTALYARFSSSLHAGLLGHTTFNFMAAHIDDPGLTIALLSACIGAIIIIFRSFIIPLLYITINALAWIARQKNFWHALGFYCKQIIRWIAGGLQKIFQHIRSLFNGTWIARTASSIVAFESGAEEVHELDAQFWATFLTQAAVNDQKEAAEVHTTPITPATATDGDDDAKENEEIAYQLPETALLSIKKTMPLDKRIVADMDTQARLLEEKLAHFGIQGSVVGIKRGPVVTLFEYKPDIDARISKITALEDDLALALQALSIRIIAPIPGKSVIGFEVANTQRSTVPFAEVLATELFEQSSLILPLALGVDTVGNKVVVDLAKMPHLLIAGSTGSGKSVALQTMIMSLLYKRTPDDLKLILVDPKRLEFAAYADIAHLLFPIVMQPKNVLPVLKWVVTQMEKRYEMMTSVGARNIGDYQQMALSNIHLEPMPYMVVIIDEFADLMMTCGKEIEDYIARIAQMARAAGIHMIIATQRPSVDVITGLIKVNFPSRISCRVTTKVDSRTILDCNGAEKLLGRGDMLFLDAADSTIKRVHGAYVADVEITKVVHHIKSQKEVAYLNIDEVCPSGSAENEEEDELYKDILIYLKDIDEISISLLQRKFKIGYNRSARIIDVLATQGFIMPADGSKMRKVIHR